MGWRVVRRWRKSWVSGPPWEKIQHFMDVRMWLIQEAPEGMKFWDDGGWLPRWCEQCESEQWHVKIVETGRDHWQTQPSCLGCLWRLRGALTLWRPQALEGAVTEVCGGRLEEVEGPVNPEPLEVQWVPM